MAHVEKRMPALHLEPIPFLLHDEFPRRLSDDFDVDSSNGEVGGVGHGDASVKGDVSVVVEEVRDWFVAEEEDGKVSGRLDERTRM